MSTNDNERAIRGVIERVDEHDSVALEGAHYELVVHDLVVGIDGRLELTDHLPQRVDSSNHTRAEATRAQPG